jgi:hypothetical protein
MPKYRAVPLPLSARNGKYIRFRVSRLVRNKAIVPVTKGIKLAVPVDALLVSSKLSPKSINGNPMTVAA